MIITSIPELIALHGNMAAACRATGLNEITLAKYRNDKECERHIICNGRLMTHKRHSSVIYSRRGITRTERANGY